MLKLKKVYRYQPSGGDATWGRDTGGDGGDNSDESEEDDTNRESSLP